MNFKENKRKYLLYGTIVVMFILSLVLYKVSISANSDDNKIAIRSAKIKAILTGTGDDWTADSIVEDDEGNISSYTAGNDSADSNRLVRSNDSITYKLDYTIGGKNDDNQYYSRTVNVTVDLSDEEARYIAFEPNQSAGETSHTYSFDNVSSTSGENEASFTLYVLNGENGKEIAPKITIKESTDSDTGVVLGKNGGNLEYGYENGSYTNTNRSTVANYLPTVVSSINTNAYNYRVVNTQNDTVYAGQKALYENQSGRYFTGVLEVSVPKEKGKNFESDSLSLPVSVTQTGNGTPVIKDNWVRLYNTEVIDTIESVAFDTAYSTGDGSTRQNETRFPGTVAYSGNNLTVTGLKQVFAGPSVTASGRTITGSNNIIGTYAISVFSPRTVDDGKNDVTVTLTVGDASKAVQFTNSYYQSSDYDLTSGFYNENGTERLTTHINDEGAVVQLNSSTSKGSTITYRTDFNYQKTLSNSGLKEVIKVDPIAFRVMPKSDNEDIDIEVNCGQNECSGINKDSFDIKYVTKNFEPGNYNVPAVDQRISPENIDVATNGCANVDLASLNTDQVMNLYGGPCVAENEEESYTSIKAAKDENGNEKPITKVVIQTKEGVALPDNAKVTVKVYLRVRNVPDITRSYQAGVVASTSDTDSELYYYSPSIDQAVNPNNYVRSTFQGYMVINSAEPYADSIRIVNFTARQDLTVTNKLSDGQIKTSYAVDENDTIKYKVSTNIQDMNENVGADDVWYFKALKVYVNVPSTLEYIPDNSLLKPEVFDYDGGKTLVYTLPWTKPNMKIQDIYFKTKLIDKLEGTRVPIVVTSRIEPININGEADMSELEAKTASFTIYGTGSKTVLLSQTNDNPTIVDKDSTFTYSLHAYNNSDSEVEDYVITDILPYNKDNRGSVVDGSYEVKVVIPSTQPTAKLYCSKKDPKTYSGESNNNDEGFSECDPGEFVSATAIRVSGIKLGNSDDASKTMDPIKVTLKTKNNKFDNRYVNNFVGGNKHLTDKKSNKIEYQVISRTISGRVFSDSDQDGVRADNEPLISGLNVTLYKVEQGKLVDTGKTVTTNKKGEYEFKNLDAGFYKVRIEYNSGSYDLALRYGSENRATDSDAYKIKEGLAEISGKNAPGTIDGIDLSKFDNPKAEDMDMGLIPRVSFGFEMKKFITQVDLNYNNTINTTKYNNESIVSLNVRNTLNATAKVYYGISIRNNSTKAGYVKLVREDIPQGLYFDDADPYNKDWFRVGDALQSNVLADKLLQPGDTAYLQIALNMPNRDTGNTFVNTASVIDVEPYIPEELAKEAEFQSDSYVIGDAVSYAGVNWHVVNVVDTEEGQDVTLLADSGTITNAMSHTSSNLYKWGDSTIREYINNGWLSTNSLNAPILRDATVCNDASSLEGTSYGGTLVSDGTCTTNDYVTTKIRLLTVNEYNNVRNTVSDPSWLYTKDFWLMNAVNSEIAHGYYGEQLNPDVNYKGVYISANGTSAAVADGSTKLNKEVRPVITVSNKNIIGQ